MPRIVRSEISKRDLYHIPKERQLELEHFCRQYPDWLDLPLEERLTYASRIEMVMDAASETDPELADYLLMGITRGWSYDVLNARMSVPCCREVYYKLYRRFFWILDKMRG